ncbi:MAG: hypothetical protein VCA55_02520 [Verrucomicrobiales bacterium]
MRTFSELQADDTANPGWRQVGSLRVALNDERVQEFEGMKVVADEAGLETEFIDPAAAKTVAVSCPFCLTMMSDSFAAKDDSVQVRDIAELMAEEKSNQP